jgi:hypothetical protein
MKTSDSPYRCSKHGFYLPDFDRKIDGHDCPRILCAQCEEESYVEELNQRPRNVKYFYEDKEAVILQEAHNGSAVWKFDPPVIYPEWSFAEDLTPIIPDAALTSEEIMMRMEELLPEVERLCKKQGIEMPDAKDLLIMPGRHLRVGEAS